MKLFEIDVYGPIHIYGTKLFNLIALNFMFILLSFFSFGLLLPVSTMGLNHGAYESVVENGYSIGYFFTPFKKLKKKFKTLYLMPLGIYLLAFITVFNIYNIITGTVNNMTWLIPVYLFCLFELLLISIFAIPLALRTNMRFKNIIKLSFALGNKHFITSLLCVAMIIASIAAIAYWMLLPILIIPSILTSIVSYFVVKRIFPKYDFSSYEVGGYDDDSIESSNQGHITLDTIIEEEDFDDEDSTR